MSKTLKRIVAKYVDGNGDYANVCDEEKDDVKRLLEQRVTYNFLRTLTAE